MTSDPSNIPLQLQIIFHYRFYRVERYYRVVQYCDEYGQQKQRSDRWLTKTRLRQSYKYSWTNRPTIDSQIVSLVIYLSPWVYSLPSACQIPISCISCFLWRH